MSGISAKTTGIKEIDRRLAELAGKEARKVVRAGVGAGLVVLNNELKAQTRAASISPEMKKALLTTIGKRFAKAKAGANKGTLQAKAGFSVGKKMNKPAKGGRLKGHGVGLSANNAHWGLLGTGERETGGTSKRTKMGRVRVLNGKRVHSTGKMPKAPPIAQQAAAAASSKAFTTMEATSRKKLEEVVTALNRK